MSLSKSRFVLLWLGSAIVVTLARLLNAADLGYDLTIQIQAAQNFLAGKGFSIYWPTEADLAKPAKLLTLTHFPAGYSLCAAALITAGFSLGAVVKTCGAVGTIFGWWGWGKLAYPFFKEGLSRGRTWILIGAAIAISTPLLFTPPWKGTDIFLWAIVPWVLQWLVKASDEDAANGLWFDVLTGAVCGLSLLMRYAGVFLVAYAGFLILCQSKARLKVLTRWVAFAAGLLPILAVQIYLNYFASNTTATPGGLSFKQEGWAAVQRLQDGLWMVTTANIPVVWWMPRKLVTLFTQPGDQAPWLLVATFVIFALVPSLFARKLGYPSVVAASRDVRMAAIGLFIVIPPFLWICMMFSDFPYVGDPRYYAPLIPLAAFVAYAFAIPDSKDESKLGKLLRVGNLGYLIGYVCMATTGAALVVFPGGQGFGKRVRFMGTSELDHWPSMKVTYEFSPARAYIASLLNDQPDIILVTNREYWFYADPTLDRSRIYRIETPANLRASHISGPAHVLILGEHHQGDPVRTLYWYTHDAKRRPADYLERLPDLHLLKQFPEEDIKVLEAIVPAGARIFLKETEDLPNDS